MIVQVRGVRYYIFLIDVNYSSNIFFIEFGKLARLLHSLGKFSGSVQKPLYNRGLTHVLYLYMLISSTSYNSEINNCK